jgi:hypothetical protein
VAVGRSHAAEPMVVGTDRLLSGDRMTANVLGRPVARGAMTFVRQQAGVGWERSWIKTYGAYGCVWTDTGWWWWWVQKPVERVIVKGSAQNILKERKKTFIHFTKDTDTKGVEIQYNWHVNVCVFAAVNRSLSQHYAEVSDRHLQRWFSYSTVRDPRSATQHTADTSVYT